MLKIGIIGVGYQCKHLNEILKPWIEIKNLYPDSFYISITTALFKEQWELGHVYDNKEMEEEISSLLSNNKIDYFNIIKDPILDFQSRNYCWENLKSHDLDLTWQLDLFDEYYSFDEILRTIEWINENNLYNTYRVNFKNFFGKENSKKYILDFNPPRINWVKKFGKLKNWYWDNWVEYDNGQKSEFASHYTIPTNICNPKHLSWVGDKEFLVNKINYQHKAIGCCSYKWDDLSNDLIFDLDYYKKYNKEVPKVYNEYES